MDNSLLTTEYLIMHEDEIDWEDLSRDPNRSFSLVEVRLFRKHINWNKYLPIHKNSVTTEILEIASKYFTEKTYTRLSYMNIATEEFILNHKDQFDIPVVILNSKPSAEFLLETIDIWKDNENVKRAIPVLVNLTKPEYKDIRLIYEVE